MDQLEMDKIFYFSLCSKEEIERIFNVKTAEDQLLKLRADETVDNVRIHRVMLKRRNENRETWNFSNHFKTTEFDDYLNFLSMEDKQKCQKIAKGFIFSNQPYGQIMRTEVGDIILISESQRYFLFFMNLYFFSEFEIPDDVSAAALRIAIRTMLKSEALDFELDPRGIIPIEVEYRINQIVAKQLEFLIGHEFSHYFLGHLDSEKIINLPLFKAFKNETEPPKEFIFYSTLQEQEFEADIDALLRPNYTDKQLASAAYNAMIFFVYIDIYECVSNIIFPPTSVIKTHPNPIDRIWNIYNKISQKVELNKKVITDYIEHAELLKKYLNKNVGYDVDAYEFYGSVYLGSWRGPILRDRVDY